MITYINPTTDQRIEFAEVPDPEHLKYLHNNGWLDISHYTRIPLDQAISRLILETSYWYDGMVLEAPGSITAKLAITKPGHGFIKYLSGHCSRTFPLIYLYNMGWKAPKSDRNYWAKVRMAKHVDPVLAQLMKLPDPYAAQAISNYKNYPQVPSVYTHVTTIAAAIDSFDWNKTPEGWDHWMKLWTQYVD